MANWLLEKGLDVLIVHHDQAGKGPSYVLGNGGAEILLTEKANASQALAIELSKWENRKSSKEGKP